MHLPIRSVAVLAAGALLGACQSPQTKPAPAPIEEPARLEPVLPTGYVKTAPAPAYTSRAILAQTAAIVSGRITGVGFSFDNCDGPRTNYVLSEVTSLFGSAVPPQVTLSLFGGPTPGGTWMSSDHTPPLALNGRYTVFLRNTDWTFNPVLRNLAFRSETVSGREVLVDPGGRLVTGWGASGPVLSEAVVFDEVGRSVRGYRDAQAGVRRGGPVADAAAGAAVPELRRGPARIDTPATRPADPIDAGMTRDELMRSGLFARPAPLPGADLAAVRGAWSPDALVSAVRAESERVGVSIGGKVAWRPYWRCWDATRTTKVSQR